ncbi:hypothetical protein [uncultured Fretibacterium sp.]|uniref:hypothetical protein n=1 Tax=uncultured Fretibacterium sp. TaxID=1678694 RepID=UPI002612C70C|nr:hypothetical protein [uncultured Fretibacterium sp.]
MERRGRAEEVLKDTKRRDPSALPLEILESLDVNFLFVDDDLVINGNGWMPHDEVVMHRGLTNASQSDACSNPYMGSTLHPFVLQHDAAHAAFGIQPNAKLSDVVSIVVILFCKVAPQPFSLGAAAGNLSDISFFYSDFKRFVDDTDSEIRDTGIADDGPLCAVLLQFLLQVLL